MKKAKNRRDDFAPKIKEALAKRASFICSNPNCRSLTLAASNVETEKFIYNGVAAHITAASVNGPRYDKTLTSEQRKSIENAIFLCSSCAKIIDKNSGLDFSVKQLRKWKTEHERWVRNNLNKSVYSLVKSSKGPVLKLSFAEDQSVKIKISNVRPNNDSEEARARSELIQRTIRLDLFLSNVGEIPSHDIDLFLKFPSFTQIYNNESFENAWYLDPFDIIEDPENYFRQASGKSNVPAMQQLKKGLLFEAYKLTVASVGSPNSIILGNAVAVSKIELNEVRFHIDKLKQNLSKPLESLYVVFRSKEDVDSFTFEYRINADEFPKDETGDLKVIVSFVSNNT